MRIIMDKHLGHLFDLVIVAILAVLAYFHILSEDKFVMLVAPIVGIRVWQVRNGGPPPGSGKLASSAALMLVWALAGFLFDDSRRAVS